MRYATTLSFMTDRSAIDQSVDVTEPLQLDGMPMEPEHPVLPPDTAVYRTAAMRTSNLDKRVSENRKCFDQDHAGRYGALRKAIDAQHDFTRQFYDFLGATHLTNHSSAEKPNLFCVDKE